MNDTLLVYSRTFKAPQGKQPRVIIGALARFIYDKRELEGQRWDVVSVTPQFDLGAVIYHQNLTAQPVIIAVAKASAESYLLRLQIHGDFLSEQDLQHYADEIEAGWHAVFENTMDFELRMEFNRRLQETELGKLNGSVDKDESSFKWALKVLFTNHPVQAVAWVAIINIALFIAMVIAGVGFFDADTDKVIQWGAASKEQIFTGQYWRLLTAIFVHFGIGHLAGNMIALLFASAFLMMVLSKWQFLIGYLITGIFSFAISIWWHIDTVSAGASGAIFGCYGILLGLALTPLFTKSDRAVILIYLAVYAGFNLLYGLKDGIDNAAHVGGLVAGVVVGLLYYPAIKSGNKAVKGVMVLLVIGLGLACSAAILSPAGKFFRLDRQYSAFEHQGMQVYNLSDTTVEVELQLLEESLHAFQQAKPVAIDMQQIKIKPPYQQRYAARLLDYTDLRITEAELLHEAYLHDSNQWDDSIRLTVNKIDSLLSDFKADY